MSLFRAARQLVESRSALNNPDASMRDVFASVFGFESAADPIPVTVRSTLGYPPVSEAVTMIADDVAKIPLNLYRRTQDERQKESDHPAHRLVNLDGAPCEESTPFDFWFDVMVDALLTGRGKGLAWIERQGPKPVAVHRLIAADWRPIRSGGRLFWANYGSPPIVLSDEDVICIRGLCTDGLSPDDPIRLYCDTLRVGISNQRFASNFFNNGAHVGGVLMAPPGASETAIGNVEKSVTKKQDPSNWFKTLILRDGFRWQTTTVDPKASQTIETDAAVTRHVARMYKLPPSKLGLSDTVAYNSLENDNKQYYGSTLTPWMRRIASQCKKKLLTPREIASGDLFFEHLIDALQWADSTTRATIATQAVQSGWMTANEVRRWYNLPPIEGGKGE